VTASKAELALLAAYQQGMRDFASGWSLSKARYADRRKDEAWQRGYLRALQEKRKGMV
jgi:hypothetical protein